MYFITCVTFYEVMNMLLCQARALSENVLAATDFCLPQQGETANKTIMSEVFSLGNMSAKDI